MRVYNRIVHNDNNSLVPVVLPYEHRTSNPRRGTKAGNLLRTGRRRGSRGLLGHRSFDGLLNRLVSHEMRGRGRGQASARNDKGLSRRKESCKEQRRELHIELKRTRGGLGEMVSRDERGEELSTAIREQLHDLEFMLARGGRDACFAQEGTCTRNSWKMTHARAVRKPYIPRLGSRGQIIAHLLFTGISNCYPRQGMCARAILCVLALHVPIAPSQRSLVDKRRPRLVSSLWTLLSSFPRRI